MSPHGVGFQAGGTEGEGTADWPLPGDENVLILSLVTLAKLCCSPGN